MNIYIYILMYLTQFLFRFAAVSIVGLGLWLVVGLESVLVVFFCIFSFRMYIKRAKISTRSSAAVA